MNLEENTKPDTKKAPETWTKKTIGDELCILLPQVIIKNIIITSQHLTPSLVSL